MFSGIIEALGRVRASEPRDKSRLLRLATPFTDAELGESIAVNGVCLTVAQMTANGVLDFFVSPETIERSNLGAAAVDGLVNLERSVRLETRLSGHLVQGHVDGRAELVSVVEEAEARKLELQLPGDLMRYCVEKGSIALNGISLTLNAVAMTPAGTARIAVTIIPHTWDHTNLSAMSIGDRLNVEVDVMAKYVERLCQPYLTR